MNDLILTRRWLTSESTIGVLDLRAIGIDDPVFTLEDSMRTEKIWGETCIPEGEYLLDLRNVGGMTARYQARFPDIHRGMIWLRHVPNFEWIYIHLGNTAADTLGCILIGETRTRNAIGSSRDAYRRIYPALARAIQSRPLFIRIRTRVQLGEKTERPSIRPV